MVARTGLVLLFPVLDFLNFRIHSLARVHEHVDVVLDVIGYGCRMCSRCVKTRPSRQHLNTRIDVSVLIVFASINTPFASPPSDIRPIEQLFRWAPSPASAPSRHGQSARLSAPTAKLKLVRNRNWRGNQWNHVESKYLRRSDLPVVLE